MTTTGTTGSCTFTIAARSPSFRLGGISAAAAGVSPGEAACPLSGPGWPTTIAAAITLAAIHVMPQL
jgi:hypothetical protein